jgi:hypothetical protein
MGIVKIAAILIVSLLGNACENTSVQPPANDGLSRKGITTGQSSLLRDSELRYEITGGFAGLVRGAALKASDAKVTVEYRPDQSPSKPSKTGTLAIKDYLALWWDLERAGLWELRAGTESEAGGDLFQHRLSARVGPKVHDFTWTEPTSSSTNQTAGSFGKKILQSSQRAIRGSAG